LRQANWGRRKEQEVREGGKRVKTERKGPNRAEAFRSTVKKGGSKKKRDSREKSGFKRVQTRQGRQGKNRGGLVGIS